MSKNDIAWQEQRLDELLYADLDPVTKVQMIVNLGFSEEIANSLVERHQLGLQNTVYYESLDFVDDNDERDDLRYFAE